jgi:hypothetical protein
LGTLCLALEEQTMIIERLKSGVITVGHGRGFVIEGAGERLVITAAHCLPCNSPKHPKRGRAATGAGLQICRQADATALAGERVDLLDIADQYDRIADRLLRTGAEAALSRSVRNLPQLATVLRRDQLPG